MRINLLKLPGAFLTKDASGRFIVGIYVDTATTYFIPQKSKEPAVYASINAWAVKDGQGKKGETHLLRAERKQGEGETPILGNVTPIAPKQPVQENPFAGANPFAGFGGNVPPPPMQGFAPPTGWGM